MSTLGLLRLTSSPRREGLVGRSKRREAVTLLFQALEDLLDLDRGGLHDLLVDLERFLGSQEVGDVGLGIGELPADRPVHLVAHVALEGLDLRVVLEGLLAGEPEVPLGHSLGLVYPVLDLRDLLVEMG